MSGSNIIGETAEILAIIVNWNKREMLEPMLRSLFAQEGPQFDAVVVDNASTDGSVEMVREKFPQCHVIVNPQNLGGTGGFNRGMKYGLNSPRNYKYFWLLDNDVILQPNALTGLLQAIESGPRTALAGSTILLMDDPSFVQDVGGTMDWRSGGLNKISRGPASDIHRPQIFEADYVSACSALARVEAIREVGIWDPAYFVFWDDVEWGVRFKRAGWRVVATTESQVQHDSFEHRRTNKPALSDYIACRNGVYFMGRFAPALLRPFVLFRAFRIIGASIDNYEADGNYPQARALRTAMRDAATNRMGPPPPEVATLRPESTITILTESAVKGKLRCAALFAPSDAAYAWEMYKRLKDDFAASKVELLVFTGESEILKENLPPWRIINIRTFPQRLGLALSLALNYDAVAGASSLHRFFFERFVKYQVRFDKQLVAEIRQRSLVEIARLGSRRLTNLVRAMVYTVRMLATPRRPVNYFDLTE